MSSTDNLTPAEREATQAMIGALIDEVKKHGFELMGIGYPAIAIREAVAEWLVAARKFRPVSTAS